MNIPQTGADERKVKFFKEVANAFEFLSLYHSLTTEQQLDVMQYLTKLQAGGKNEQQ